MCIRGIGDVQVFGRGVARRGGVRRAGKGHSYLAKMAGAWQGDRGRLL